MSVRMTRTCFPHSYAKYSAVVRAIQGVIIGSIVGSFACKDKGARYLAQLSYYHLTHLIDKVNKIYQIPGSEKELTRSIEPFSSKSRFKNWAVSIFTPTAATTMAKLSSSPLRGFKNRNK
jgi:hypothetical protein